MPARAALITGATVLAVLAVAGAAFAAAVDPAADALSSRDAYVSPRALGPAAPAADAELRDAAERLDLKGQPVKLAIVAGPAGAPSRRRYARRLAEAVTDERTTLVVTAPGRPVVAAGPRSPADITRRLRAGGVGAVANPVDRVIRAAELAVPPPPDDAGSGTRAVLVMFGLAALGAAWAVAWAARRRASGDRERMLEARAAAIVRLDAAAARAGHVLARPDLRPAARAEAQRAMTDHDEAAESLKGARSVAVVEAVAPGVRRALAAASRAEAAAGEEPHPDDPFEGLCAADPAHGPAVAEAVLEGGEVPVGVCARCAEEAAEGRPPRRRLVPIGGRPAPFTEIDAEGPGQAPR